MEIDGIETLMCKYLDDTVTEHESNVLLDYLVESKERQMILELAAVAFRPFNS